MSRLQNNVFLITYCHWSSSFTPALHGVKMSAGTCTYFLSWSQEAELGLLFHGFQGLCECGANAMMGRDTEEAERDVIDWWLSIHQQQSISKLPPIPLLSRDRNNASSVSPLPRCSAAPRLPPRSGIAWSGSHQDRCSGGCCTLTTPVVERLLKPVSLHHLAS